MKLPLKSLLLGNALKKNCQITWILLKNCLIFCLNRQFSFTGGWGLLILWAMWSLGLVCVCCIKSGSPFIFWQTPSEGADTILYLALSPDVERESGWYYDNCQKHKTCQLSYSEKDIKEMFTISTDIINSKVS